MFCCFCLYFFRIFCILRLEAECFLAQQEFSYFNTKTFKVFFFLVSQEKNLQFNKLEEKAGCGQTNLKLMFSITTKNLTATATKRQGSKSVQQIQQFIQQKLNVKQI